MAIMAHLRELRRRFIIAVLAILVVSIGGWSVTDLIWDALREPILAVAAQQDRVAKINYPDITSGFDLKLQLSFTVGLILSAPVWLYQIWAFIVPALKQTERRYALSFLLTAVPLFFGGCFVGWMILPNMVSLMTSFQPAEDDALISARAYFDLTFKLLFAVGVAFVVPLVLVLLNFLGLLQGSTIRKGWRAAIMCIAVFAALATPAADMISMVLLIVVMTALYGAAVLVTWLRDGIVAKRRLRLLEGSA